MFYVLNVLFDMVKMLNILPLQIHAGLSFAPFIDRNQMMRISLRKMDESLILYGFNCRGSKCRCVEGEKLENRKKNIWD